MYFGATDTRIKLRQILEATIVTAVVTEALKRGYSLRVDDGNELHPKSTDKTEILNRMMETDEDYLYFFGDGSNASAGWIRFVYGNDGDDVISDHSANKETYQLVNAADPDKIINRLVMLATDGRYTRFSA